MGLTRIAITRPLSILMFMINFVVSALKREKVSSDPWGGATLEWATTSPPPDYNFVEVPTVKGRNPLWASKAEGSPAPAYGR